jgi:hypothetical protein
MNDSATPKALDNAIMRSRVIVLALVSSAITLSAVAVLLGNPRDGAEALRLPLVGGALAAVVGSVLMRRLNLSWPRLEDVYLKRGGPGLATHLATSTIISAVLAEAVAVFGLVLALLTGDVYYAAVLGGVSVVSVLFNLPRASHWREAYNSLSMRFPSGSAASRVGRQG